MRKLSALAVICSASLLSACGSSDDNNGGTTPPEETTSTSFAISVDAPPSLITTQIQGISLFTQAYADPVDSLTKDNFAVAIIDADGNVIENVELTDEQWSQEPDGSYVITLPGGVRLDCVILVDLDGTPAVQLNQPLPSDNIFAPTTSEAFQVDLSSTAAYRAVVEQIAAASTSGSDWGDFASAVPSGNEVASDVSVAQQLVSSVIEEVREQIEQAILDSGNDFTLEDILEDPAVQELADNVVDRIETETGAADSNVAELLQQGFWWVNSYSENDYLEFETGNISFDGVTTSESLYIWDVKGGEALDLTMADEEYAQTIATADTTGYEVDRWVLGSEGWLADYDMPLFRSADASSATMTNIGLHSDASLDRTISLKQVDLAGASIRAFAATEDASDLVPYIPANAMFSEGAQAYLGSETAAEDRYRIYNWDCEQEGEFCNRIYRNMGGGAEEAAPTSLDALFSEQAAEENDYAMQGIWMTPTQAGNTSVLAEFVQDDANTVNFYKIFHNDQTTEKLSFSTTWQTQTVSGQEIVRVSLPLALVAYGAESDDLEIFFTVAEGLVRRGNVEMAGTENFYLFNQQAIEDMGDALHRESCDLEGLATDFSEQQYKDFFASCAYLSASDGISDFYDGRLVRIAGSDGTTRAYDFNEDGSVDYYRAGVLLDGVTYSVTDEGFIKVEFADDSYDLLTFVAAEDLENQDELLTVAVFTQDSELAEAWYFKGWFTDRAAIYSCGTGDSDWDDANEVPVEGTEKVLANYQAAVTECQMPIAGRVAKFDAERLKGTALKASYEEEQEEEYYLFSDVASSEAGWYEGEVRIIHEQLSIDMIWQVTEAGELKLRATFDDGSGAVDIEETNTIVASNGVEFSLKIFAQQSNWATDFDYMSADEGEIWSDVRTLVAIDDVPAL
ncbi:hypothetical protein [Agarivorans gilvus]|uniref:Lipoprotein n=1 Tax=Agarivorans gilvus TaxID=680279 RepID=A0ABQ1I5T3_9ALTE|nr:hypothetical protein [Agarivorans gilvus]GGB14941.1 hypothetical protein GCM10007414_30480 [Agarivorans gilvus]